MAGKRPAFQFYASDWLGSTKHAMMSPAQRGAYIDLLCHQWNDPDCTLPDDDNALAALSGLNEGWFNGGSGLVRDCFPVAEGKPGRLANQRMLEVRADADEWSRKSREGGVRSGASRRAKAAAAKGCDDSGAPKQLNQTRTKREPNANQTRTNTPTKREPKGNPSPSPSPSSTEQERSCPPRPKYSVAFESWWSAYPRKVGKGKASAAWSIAVRAKPPDELLRITEQFAKSPAGNAGQFTPHPATWLTAARYDDDPNEWNRKEDHGKRSLPTGPGQRFDPDATGDDDF